MNVLAIPVAHAPSNVKDAAAGRSFIFITIVVRNAMGTLLRAGVGTRVCAACFTAFQLDFRFRATYLACGQVKNVRNKRPFLRIFHLAANQW